VHLDNNAANATAAATQWSAIAMQCPRFVLLDRDGVINEDSDDFIKSPEEWLPIPGSLEAIANLYRAGIHVAVISNQSGIARGLFSLETLDQIHTRMKHLVQQEGGKIGSVYFCPHGPNDNCNCRKPKPGLLQQFAKTNNVRLEGIPFIGDSMRDIQAGLAVGAQPLLVKTGKGLRTLAEHPTISATVFNNLYDATRFILSK